MFHGIEVVILGGCDLGDDGKTYVDVAPFLNTQEARAILEKHAFRWWL